MTRKRRRLIAVLLGLAMLAVATTLVLLALSANDSLAFFTSPTDLKAEKVPEGRRLRVGGLVEKGSVARESNGKTVHFHWVKTTNADGMPQWQDWGLMVECDYKQSTSDNSFGGVTELDEFVAAKAFKSRRKQQRAA